MVEDQDLHTQCLFRALVHREGIFEVRKRASDITLHWSQAVESICHDDKNRQVNHIDRLREMLRPVYDAQHIPKDMFSANRPRSIFLIHDLDSWESFCFDLRGL
jgi:hypothetical protein